MGMALGAHLENRLLLPSFLVTSSIAMTEQLAGSTLVEEKLIWVQDGYGPSWGGRQEAGVYLPAHISRTRKQRETGQQVLLGLSSRSWLQSTGWCHSHLDQPLCDSVMGHTPPTPVSPLGDSNRVKLIKASPHIHQSQMFPNWTTAQLHERMKSHL